MLMRFKENKKAEGPGLKLLLSLVIRAHQTQPKVNHTAGKEETCRRSNGLLGRQKYHVLERDRGLKILSSGDTEICPE